MAFFTVEDAKIAFNLFCCVYGIGTLGMPANFSRAGPYIATAALLFMAFANVYASVVCSKVMLLAPRSVKTYGDLGAFCMGPLGRVLVLVSQMAVCLLLPCAFLVLGGILLDSIFPGAFEQTTWIILMATSVLPVLLTPTMKEGAAAALAGCLGTLVADIIGAGVLLHGMSGHPAIPTPAITFKQVATTFGNLSLAYGAAIVIPALQRQHSDPARMPRIVGVTLTVISVLFLALAITGYSAVGCQISGNLLFSILPDAATGLTRLGFHADKGMVLLAYLGMQLHITIALAVVLHPAFFILERLVLGMHKTVPDASSYNAVATPGAMEDGVKEAHAEKNSVEYSLVDFEKEALQIAADKEAEAREYRQTGVAIKFVMLRIVCMAVLVALSVALRDHFLDLTDFVGASAITFSCIVLPIVFYFKLCWAKIPVYEKAAGAVVVLLCLALGGYVSYLTGKNLFTPASASGGPAFPFCHAEHQNEVYYIKSPVSTNSSA